MATNIPADVTSDELITALLQRLPGVAIVHGDFPVPRVSRDMTVSQAAALLRQAADRFESGADSLNPEG